MKARAGWREKQAVEVSGPNGGPIEHQSLEDTREPLALVLERVLAEAEKAARAAPMIDGEAMGSSS